MVFLGMILYPFFNAIDEHRHMALVQIFGYFSGFFLKIWLQHFGWLHFSLFRDGLLNFASFL